MEEVTIEGVIMDNGSAGSTGIDPKKRTILIACISCLLAVCCGLGIAYGVGAFSPAAEEGDAGQEGAAPLPDTGELTVEEVRALCADLAFDGEALAVDADAISIEVKDGQVMVTEPTDALGAPVVGAAAKKSASPSKKRLSARDATASEERSRFPSSVLGRTTSTGTIRPSSWTSASAWGGAATVAQAMPSPATRTAAHTPAPTAFLRRWGPPNVAATAALIRSMSGLLIFLAMMTLPFGGWPFFQFISSILSYYSSRHK